MDVGGLVGVVPDDLVEVDLALLVESEDGSGELLTVPPA